MSQDLRTPPGRFANFLKASEHWGPDLLLGSFHAGLPEIVVSLGDMRGTYAELVQLVARVAELEAERETDVRAVAEVIAASGGTWMATEGAIRQLGRRFADRIAALGQQNDAAKTDEPTPAYTADANQPEIRDLSVWCWNRHPDHPLPCGRLAGHDGPHARGEHRWDDAADGSAR